MYRKPLIGKEGTQEDLQEISLEQYEGEIITDLTRVLTNTRARIEAFREKMRWVPYQSQNPVVRAVYETARARILSQELREAGWDIRK